MSAHLPLFNKLRTEKLSFVEALDIYFESLNSNNSTTVICVDKTINISRENVLTFSFNAAVIE